MFKRECKKCSRLYLPRTRHNRLCNKCRSEIMSKRKTARPGYMRMPHLIVKLAKEGEIRT